MFHFKSFLLSLSRLRWWLACGVMTGVFLWNIALVYLPGQAFTFLAMFGERESAHYLPELRAMNFYALPDSHGYDGQYYAQIALRPQLADPELAQAVDNLPYRARRILFCWTAWLAGGGDPERVLLAFTLQNVAAWLLLAWLLWRWFPPDSFGNFFRWSAVLFSFGLCFSIRGSLTDGPGLLLIAGGMALAEAGRPWWSALVFGISGLGKEINLLAGAALAWPERNTVRGWAAVAGRGLLIVLPLAVWAGCIWLWIGGDGGSAGLRNFDLPLAAYLAKWRAVAGEFSEGRNSVGLWNLFVLVSLTVQFLFFALRPRWRDRWWRLGAAFALLMLVLGPAVWEGHPSAAARVLLPMLLAFNIAVPRGRKWWPVLVLGNVSLLGSPDILTPPAREHYRVDGPAALRLGQRPGQAVEVVFGAGWYQPERSRLEFWRWSPGSAGFVIRNPQAFPLRTVVHFGLRSRDVRPVRVVVDGRTVWEGTVSPDLQRVRVPVELPPGELPWWLETAVPPVAAGGADSRLLAFSIRDLKLELLGRADAPPADKSQRR